MKKATGMNEYQGRSLWGEAWHRYKKIKSLLPDWL